jgi:hypothetical protein
MQLTAFEKTVKFVNVYAATVLCDQTLATAKRIWWIEDSLQGLAFIFEKNCFVTYKPIKLCWTGPFFHVIHIFCRKYFQYPATGRFKYETEIW